jgi:hypothetical protein
MNREGHENVDFFYGTEVEHTPAYGKYTLFVVGIQSQSDIALKLTSGSAPVEHIYFGANMSFPNPKVDDARIWKLWENMIQHFLDLGYWCTLDIDSTAVEGLCEGGLIEYANFIPMISVKLPYLRLLGYNATIKLDDKDFNATNAGVWCHSVHDLTARDHFTSWQEYTKDEKL